MWEFIFSLLVAVLFDVFMSGEGIIHRKLGKLVCAESACCVLPSIPCSSKVI